MGVPLECPKTEPAVLRACTYAVGIQGLERVSNFGTPTESQSGIGAIPILHTSSLLLTSLHHQGPNEPEFPEQANLSVDQAVQLWKQFLQPLTSLGIRLGSPAISSAPAGKKWLKEFLNHCQGCSVDFIALHWYGEDWMNMRNYLLEMHALFPNYTIWLTEFAETRSDPASEWLWFSMQRCAHAEIVIQKFMVNALPWLDSHAFIERYAWFCYAVSDTRVSLS